MEWKNLIRGFLMGTSDLIPGVSGGTIAVMLGIYHEFLSAISGFFSRNWKHHLKFLAPLAVGMLSAIFLLSRLIDWLLEYHFEVTQFFFLGLIIGMIPFLFKEADARSTFSVRHYIVLAIGVGVVGLMALLPSDSSAEPITSREWYVLVGLFFSGWLASMAMLLPGISGSLLLLLVGVYPTAIDALSNLDILLIAVIGTGILVGFIASSKGIRYFLRRFPSMTYALMIGLIIGSVFVVFPGFVEGMRTWILCILTFLAGLSISVFFQRR